MSSLLKFDDHFYFPESRIALEYNDNGIRFLVSAHARSIELYVPVSHVAYLEKYLRYIEFAHYHKRKFVFYFSDCSVYELQKYGDNSYGLLIGSTMKIKPTVSYDEAFVKLLENCTLCIP